MINYSLPSIDIELVWPPHRALMLVGYVCGLTWTVCSVLQTKVHEVVILVVLQGRGSLVGHLVSPLLHGLHHGVDDGRLGDGSGWGSHKGPGLGQTQAVSHSGGD